MHHPHPPPKSRPGRVFRQSDNDTNHFRPQPPQKGAETPPTTPLSTKISKNADELEDGDGDEFNSDDDESSDDDNDNEDVAELHSELKIGAGAEERAEGRGCEETELRRFLVPGAVSYSGSRGSYKVNPPSDPQHALEIARMGGRVTSMVLAGKEVLYRGAGRSGLELAWPQLGRFGPLEYNGFVKKSGWALVGSEIDYAQGCSEATFCAVSDEGTRAVWSKEFSVEMGLTVGPAGFKMSVKISNTAASGALSFTGGPMVCLGAPDIRKAAIRGLQGVEYIDQAKEKQESSYMRRNAPLLTFEDDPFDRIYQHAPSGVKVDLAEGLVVSVAWSGFPDLSVWQPGAEAGARAGGNGDPLLVGPCHAFSPITLPPGGSWQGSLTITL